MEIIMLELDFTQTLGSHCLQIVKLPASGITAVLASPARENLAD
jgi:hypothetical protein